MTCKEIKPLPVTTHTVQYQGFLPDFGAEISGYKSKITPRVGNLAGYAIPLL